jgi:TRAP-type mannitol/chloroaromatic compound transport system permease large subunit
MLGGVYAGLALLGLGGGPALRAAVRGGSSTDALTSTLTMTAMIFATILAAGLFSLVFIGLGGEERVEPICWRCPAGRRARCSS